MKKKYYHCVLKKNGHFYYEIFEEHYNPTLAVRTIFPTISLFDYDETQKTERTFTFKTVFDLKHNHTQNNMLLETLGEERLFFLSSIEVIDSIKKFYTDLAQIEISQILKKYDNLND
jgi:hypothetical protein